MERARNMNRLAAEIKPVVKHKPLEQFILEAHDQNVCGNVLDLPNLRPEAPHWIT